MAFVFLILVFFIDCWGGGGGGGYLISIAYCPFFHFTHFPYKSIRDQIWPCPKRNRSRSIQGHHLNKLGSTRAPNAAYQVSRSSAFWFWRRRFFKVFAIYAHGGHLGHVTCTSWTNFRSSISWSLHMKFDFDWPSGFWGEDVWKCWHTYTIHIRKTEAYLSSYKLTTEPSAQVS